MRVDEVGQLAVLAAKHCPDSELLWSTDEAVLSQPVVVEYFRQVTTTTVREQDDDDSIRVVELVREPHGRLRCHARRTADEQRLLAGESAGEEERVAVGYGHDAVGDGAVVCIRPEVLPHSFDEVGSATAAGVHRALGVGADHLDAAAGDLLEVTTGAADGSPRPDAGDEVRD